MNSFELNKILGALLATCLILLSLNIGASALFSAHPPEKPGYNIAVQEKAPAGPGGPAEPEKPIAVLLASASVEKGAAAAKQCGSCHTFEKGGPNRVGPNLYDIIGHERGTGRNGFNFSAAMKAKGGNWTYEELNVFLTNPRAAIPGTNMTFAGISRDTVRADLIAYMRSLSDSPQPLPAAADAGGAKPAAAAAPAAGAAPAEAPKKP